jgi:hypothetical protein
MIIKHSSRMTRHFCYAALIGTLCVGSVSAAKIAVPVFLFSGQSNMVGLGATASTADQKKTVENIKVDCIADQNIKKWTILGPGFGSNSSQFGPELFFGRTLTDSMPNTKLAFIKDAVSGTYLGKSAGGWLPPSSDGNTGDLYTKMMTHIDNAMKTFTTAFDTTQYTPRWAGFIWLQGEFDGMNDPGDKIYADAYETNLTNLIKDIRSKVGVDSLPVIIPMIDASPNWKLSATIRKAEIAVVKKTINADTMDTKGLPTDNIHYKADGMVTIGRVCAQRWLAMKYTKDWWTTTPVISQHDAKAAYASRHTSTAILPATMFDLRGRCIGTSSSIKSISARGIFIARTGNGASGVCRPVANITR